MDSTLQAVPTQWNSGKVRLFGPTGSFNLPLINKVPKEGLLLSPCRGNAISYCVPLNGLLCYHSKLLLLLHY